MGEGGAAPIHTISAALQDALFAEGIIIADSYNNADSMFRAIAKKEIYQSKDHVQVGEEVNVRKPITCTKPLMAKSVEQGRHFRLFVLTKRRWLPAA